jgi:hypothetical protein
MRRMTFMWIPFLPIDRPADGLSPPPQSGDSRPTIGAQRVTCKRPDVATLFSVPSSSGSCGREGARGSCLLRSDV